MLWLVYHMLWADFLVSLGTRLWYVGTDGRVGNLDSEFVTLRSAD